MDEVAADVTARGAELAATIGQRSWRALELTKLALRSQRQASTTFDSPPRRCCSAARTNTSG